MQKKYFSLRLLSPRPKFPTYITDGERAIMKAHSDYWKGSMREGYVLAFGPVLYPKGMYGLGYRCSREYATSNGIYRKRPGTDNRYI